MDRWGLACNVCIHHHGIGWPPVLFPSCRAPTIRLTLRVHEFLERSETATIFPIAPSRWLAKHVVCVHHSSPTRLWFATERFSRRPARPADPFILDPLTAKLKSAMAASGPPPHKFDGSGHRLNGSCTPSPCIEFLCGLHLKFANGSRQTARAVASDF